ncbi:c-type cytochrome [Shimia sp. W99]
MKRIACFVSFLGFCAATVAAQEFTTLKGHGGPIMGLAVSVEGQVVSASFDNTLGLWSGRKVAWLDAHDAAVVSVAFLEDGRIVSGGDDFTVRVWENGQARILGRHKGKVAALSSVPGGQMVASASWDGTAVLWPLGQGETRVLSPRDSGVNDVTFSPNGTHAFLATTKGEVLRFELSEDVAAEPLVQHGFGVNRLMMAPNGEWLAYGAVDGGTRIVDPATGDAIADFTLDRKPILALAYHAQSGLLAVGDGHGYIMLVDTQRWRIQKDFRAMRRGPVWALAFSPDGEMLYAGGLDDVVYGWPLALMDDFTPVGGQPRSFLKDIDMMSNGERQFMRKCSICHALEEQGRHKAGPSLYGIFGRPAGTMPGYRYSEVIKNSRIVWNSDTIDQLFEQGPDHYIPGSKMPMQVIAGAKDRRDLIAFIKTKSQATEKQP